MAEERNAPALTQSEIDQRVFDLPIPVTRERRPRGRRAS